MQCNCLIKYLVFMGTGVFGILFVLLQPGFAADKGLSNQAAAGQISANDSTGDLADELTDDLAADDPFSQIDTAILHDDQAQTKQSPFMIGGFVKLETEYGFNKDNEKLSKLKPVLFLETEYKINEQYKIKASGQAYWDASYRIEAKDDTDPARLDDRERQVELKDVYVDGRLGRFFSVRAGRQIVAWGESDYAKITDVINPRDLTQPGLIDLEDARLPVTALRLSGVFDAWSFDLATIHEHPGSKISGTSSDFDYYIQLRNPGIIIKEKQTPDFGMEDTGIAFKTTYAFNGGDISFLAANTYDDQPVLRYKGFEGSKMAFLPEYERMSTFGISANLAKGSSLFKVETAYKKDRKIMRDDFLSQIFSGVNMSDVKTVSKTDEISVLAGLDYTGWSDLRLTFEAQLSHILDYQDYMAKEEDEIITYFQATKNYYNDTLELDFFWVHMYPGHGNILRLSAGYDIFDDLNIQAGVVLYESRKSESELHPYKDRDRIFIRVRYSF